MAGKESNPIQQRMDLFVEKWESVVSQEGINIVRIHAEDNEKDMVDAFYTYMLGVDTPNKDVPVIFESIYHNDEQYTLAILKELEQLLDIWNNAKKDELSIEIEPINWKPDYKLTKKDNPAYLFVENMNRLASYLNLDKKNFLVAILKISFIDSWQFNRWLEFALKAGLADKFKIVVDDTASNDWYAKLAAKYPAAVATLRPRLDMDNAMQQIAAMGNPNDPAVQYRQAFIKMMQGIEKRKENETVQHANDCIEIATKNLSKNAYWIGQIIAVYAALANNQVGYKNFKKAIGYSTKGVEAAEKSQELMLDLFIQRKFQAQAIMLRASLYSADKQWEKAMDDFIIAADHYMATNDVILAMEAYRMIGYCNVKFGDINTACNALSQAIELARNIPLHIIKFTTFPGIIELLIQNNNEKYISRSAVEEFSKSIYGPGWMKEILNWKNPKYEQVTDPSKVIVA